MRAVLLYLLRWLHFHEARCCPSVFRLIYLHHLIYLQYQTLIRSCPKPALTSSLFFGISVSAALELPLASAHRAPLPVGALRVDPLDDAVHVERMAAFAPHCNRQAHSCIRSLHESVNGSMASSLASHAYDTHGAACRRLASGPLVGCSPACSGCLENKRWGSCVSGGTAADRWGSRRQASCSLGSIRRTPACNPAAALRALFGSKGTNHAKSSPAPPYPPVGPR